MAGSQGYEASFVSESEWEPDPVHSHNAYELDDVSRVSTATPSLYQHLEDQEDRHLLNSQAISDKELFRSTLSALPTNHQSDYEFKGDRSTNVKDFVDAQRLAVTRAAHATKSFVTRSGRLEFVDEEPESSKNSGFRHRWKLYGWRFGVFVAGCAVATCLIVELIMLIVALIIDKQHSRKGELYVGDCSKVDRMSTALAILLNVIATILMSTSNYVMQCLSAPSRKDVDKIHAAGSYLNIGASSVHNLIYNPSVKTILWLSLVLTSVPIHLLFNSAFFRALQANNYGVLVASTKWAEQDGYFDEDYTQNYNKSQGADNVAMFIVHMHMLKADNRVDFLDKDQCFQRYSAQLPSSISNVVVLVKDASTDYSLIPNYNAKTAPALFRDPYTTFALPTGIGLSLSPFSGNAVPMFNPNYTQTSAILPQNVSGGLYLRSEAQAYGDPLIRSVFTAFDYHYWTTIQQLKYDFNNSDVLRAKLWSPTSWMCKTDDVLAGKICTSGKNSKRPEPWLITPGNFEVDHCLSQAAPEQCSLQYSWIILVIVICCDAAKMAAMWITLFMVTDPPLATLGDAISSFLERPDPHTRGCCLLQQKEACRISHSAPLSWRFWKRGVEHSYEHANRSFAQRMNPEAVTWNHSITRWSSAPSRNRWILFGALYVALMASSLTLLGLCIRNLRRVGITDVFDQGFGSTNPNALFTNPSAFLVSSNGNTTTIQAQNTNSALFSNVVFANTPQLLFSTLYFLYNGLFTSMFTAAEWTRFATVRKALRVSTPRIGQRSTYWLQLPWKYSLPVLTMSIAIHWLVSVSLFLVRINVFSWEPQRQRVGNLSNPQPGVLGPAESLTDRDIYACGFSPLAILLVIIVVALSLVAILAISRQKFSAAIPMCGTNSLAISASCHYAENGNLDVACQPLMWGVTVSAKPGAPGHCALSDKVVETPMPGMTYR